MSHYCPSQSVLQTGDVCLVWMLAKRANEANVALLPACHLDEGPADKQRQGF